MAARRSIKFGCSIGSEWATWPDLKEACSVVEELGFDSLWTHDNLTPPETDWNDGPVLEGWTFLTTMATTTRRIRIGCMCASNTYRHPVVLAKMATTIDVISGGRLIFGIGAGWAREEHASYGIPFPPVAERMDMLEEAVQIIKLLWESKEPVTFEGRHYSLKNAPFNPKPVQRPHPPILIAGGGERRTLRAVARYADAMNVYGSPGLVAQKLQVLEQHCRRMGRNAADIEKTVLVRYVPPEQMEDWKQYLERLAVSAPDLLKRGQAEGMVGSTKEMREWVRKRVEIGVDHIILSLKAPFPYDSLASFVGEVIPEFR